MISSLDKTSQQKNQRVPGKGVRIETHLFIPECEQFRSPIGLWTESSDVYAEDMMQTYVGPVIAISVFEFIWALLGCFKGLYFPRVLHLLCLPYSFCLLFPLQPLLLPLLQGYLRYEKENLMETSCLKLCVSKSLCFRVYV